VKSGIGKGWMRSVVPIDVKNEDVCCRVNEERTVIYNMRRKKNNWIGHVLLRNSLLKHVI
jgi:hypothetical protein